MNGIVVVQHVHIADDTDNRSRHFHSVLCPVGRIHLTRICGHQYAALDRGSFRVLQLATAFDTD
jgi:hypothetical protein